MSADDNEPKGSHQLPAAAFRQLPRPIRRFAEAMLETGDVTTAYLESHPDCRSLQSAKYRGRALLKRGDVRAVIASLKQEAAGNQGRAGRKGALLAELETVAFAHVNLKKIHPKEKLTALRAIAELEGLLAPKPAGTAIRATFNFRIGGRSIGHAAGGRDVVVPRRAQALTVDVDTAADETADPASIGKVDVRCDEPVAAAERPSVLDPSVATPDRG